MRIYSDDAERRIRIQRYVQDWAGGGLLESGQAAALDQRLRTDLRRTNDLLRAALAFFAVIVAVAAIALAIITFHLDRDETASGIALAVAAAASFAIADRLVATGRLYRYGVEEALSAVAVACACISTALLTRGLAFSGGHPGVFLVGAACAAIVYLRFGFVYAAIGAMVFLAWAVSQFALSEATWRAASAALFAVMFVAVRIPRLRLGDEYPGDEYGLLQAAACAGAYISLNLQLHTTDWAFGRPLAHDAFYWATYGATWIVPPAALALAIRDKDRPLLAAGLVEAAVTLATNKPYLGIPRQSWDPVLFGVLLVAVAVSVKRWLAAGREAQRGGYTAERIASRDRELLTVASNLAVVLPDRLGAAPGPAQSAPSAFQGGRSGGGGGGASY